MGSSSSPSRTTSTTEPPAFIQPYLQEAAGQARSIYSQGPNQYYPGNTVVPFAPQTEAALAGTEARATGGSPVNQAAQGYATRTLSNDPTSQFGAASNPFAANTWQSGKGNPYLDQTFNRAADSVQNRLSSQFAGAGRNLDASRPAQAQEMNDLATNVYGGAFDAERNRQMAAYQQSNAIGAQGYENERARMASDLTSQRAQQLGVAGLAPQLANQDYVDLQALQGVGSQVEGLAGNYMEDAAARWDYQQNAPGMALDQYIARLNSYPGSSMSSMTPTYRNRTAGAVGGAMTGAMAGSMLGGASAGAASGAAAGSVVPGWGTAIGAIAGGLLGAYG